MSSRTPCRTRLGILCFLAVWSFSQTAFSLPLPVKDDASFWQSLKSDLEACLNPINPGIRSFELGLALHDGERILGTGSLKLAQDQRTSFILSTADGVCHFFSRGATATCLLRTPTDQVRFETASDGACPFPILRISKHPEQGFQLDISMNLGRLSASAPVDLAVHPETSGHICKKMQERFLFAETVGDHQRFYSDASGPLALEIRREAGKIVGFRAAVSREDRPDFWVVVDPLRAGIELPTLPETLMPEGGTVPLNGIESVMRFIKGFYAILSSLVPR